MGIRGDQIALDAVLPLLKDRDPAVRREAAIAVGKLKNKKAGPALYAALDDSDTFAAWSIRQAIRRLQNLGHEIAGRGSVGRPENGVGPQADGRSLGRHCD